MMVLVAILSETGIFDYLAVYAYKVGQNGCSLAPDSVVEHSKHNDSYISIYMVSQEECSRLQEGVPYVKLYRYNPKHLYLKLTVTEIMAREV